MKLRNHILMFVMRKLDRELPLVFGLRLLISLVWSAKGEARIFTRRGAHVTDSANCGTRSDHRLAREELLPMTTHTGVVIGKVGNVRKVSFCSPRCRNLVTFVALETLVLCR